MTSESHGIYLAHADLIERVLSAVCRRFSLYGTDAEDFSSLARIHLLEDDCAVLRRFQERSSMSSYLTVVVTRQFQDWRNARWGKWRPSAEAKRLGDVAVRLETLTARNGHTLDEAYELLRLHHGITESRASLEALAARFPNRYKRSFVDPEVIEPMAAPDPSPEDVAIRQQAAAAAEHAMHAVAGALRALPAQDRLILRMRFKDNLQIADIARALQLESKPLYRRIERLLASLRQTLEEGGLSARDMVGAWSQCGFDTVERRETFGEVRPFDRSGQAPALTGGHRE